MQKARQSATAELVERGLLHGKGLIGGNWLPAASGKTFEVLDPCTGTKVQDVAEMGAQDAESAVEAAGRASTTWRSKLVKERSSLMTKWSREVKANSSQLAALICLESGKPLPEAKGEVKYSTTYIDLYAGMQANGLIIPQQTTSTRLLVTKEPVGVCSLLTPWNFPAAMIARKAAPALLAGCTAVIKPAEDTPLTTLALVALWEKIGGPKGVLNVVPTSRAMVKEVGEVLSTHPDVRKISFTGSTAVGKQLLKQAAGTVKRTSMELGGNAPFVVFDDADLDKAVDGAMGAKFRFSGQTCICANRFIVHEKVHDDFVSKVAERIKGLRVGDGFDSRTNLGPLIHSGARQKVADLVTDALDKGANAVVGGEVEHPKGPTFFPPALLTGITPDMRVSCEEIFGPVMAVTKFSDDKQALEISNSSQSGLAGYVYGRDYSRVLQFSERLECGMVGVNETAISNAGIPFGGVKESGLGREGSVLGLDEYMETKHICLGGM